MNQPASSFSARWLSRWPVWVREALIKTLAGLLLGLATAWVLVTLGATVLSEVQEEGQDLGLRLAIYAKRLASFSSGASQGEAEAGYLFVDVDPQFPLATPKGEPRRTIADTSTQPCANLAAAMPSKFAMDDGNRSSAPSGRALLNCGSARPVNRYLLAELVRQISAWQPRMIVLDILVSAEPGVVSDDENRALIEALKETPRTGSPVPIIWADPVESSGRPGEPSVYMWPQGERVLKPDPARHLFAAVAMPVPGEPVRRYPKCVLMNTDGTSSPSLPFLAAQLARDPSKLNPGICTPEGVAQADNAPRIIYTLPSAESHQDDDNGPSRAQWAHYRPVYNRCLAAAVWQPERSACADAQAYKDRVVVLGASNPARRDRHYTPLGDMAGSEVVVNATRSFFAFPHNKDKSYGATLLKKMQIVLLCSLVWFGYFLVSCRMHRAAGPTRWARFRTTLSTSLLFFVALMAVCALVLYRAFDPDGPIPSLDVLIPVLAVGVDVYVEKVGAALHWLEAKLEKLLGIPPTEGHH